MTVSDAEALANELHAFCAAAPHDYPGHNIELFERVESFLRTLIPSDSASDAAPADCPFCGSPGLNIAGLYVTCGAPQNECPMRGVRCDIAAWNTRAPIPVAVLTLREIETTIRIEFDHSEDNAGVRRAAERVWTFLEARAKTLARRATTSVLPRSEGQAAECDGGLHTPPIPVAVSREEVARIIWMHFCPGMAASDEDKKHYLECADEVISSLPLQLHDRAHTKPQEK